FGSTVKLDAQESAIVRELWIQAVGDDSKRSQSFQNFAPEKNDPIKTDAHFHFLPAIDPVEIRWKVSAIDDVKEAEFELWSAIEKSKAIWRLKYTSNAALQVLKGPESNGTGPLGWNKLVISGEAQRFPNSCPNVAGAPYQLRLTVK